MSRQNKIASWGSAIGSLIFYLLYIPQNTAWQYVASIPGIESGSVVTILILNALAVTYSKKVQQFYTNNWGEDYHWLLYMLVSEMFFYAGSSRYSVRNFVVMIIVFLLYAIFSRQVYLKTVQAEGRKHERKY